MNAVQNVDDPASGARIQQQNRADALKPRHPSLLSYWAAAAPVDARVFRVAFFQPFFGILFVFVGIVMSALALLSQSVALGVVGLVLLVLGAVMASTAYWISRGYFKEYPGGFGAYLEEYVARRVSRLSRNEFIPRFKAQNPADAKKIRAMNDQVSLALQAELLRLAQSEHSSGYLPVCGVLVVGPEHSNKTGALWDAMKQHLGEWTFVRWPHHMDYPADLALNLGHRIVLWLDDLHDFANLGEAAALDQFIQRLHQEHRKFLVLSSCRGKDLEEAKRYFRPLINDLRRVPATPSLKVTAQSSELRTKFNALPESQQSVLETIDWLESLRVNTFPWEVLGALSNEFLSPGAIRNSDEDTLQGLANDPARFVQVNQRADPQKPLGGEKYDLLRWFRYTFVSRRFTHRRRNDKSGDVHYVIEPINVNNLDLEASRATRTEQTTDLLEQQPQFIIQRLSGSPFAAETLILLGDAYLNHLGENVENAGKLANLCYDGALKTLNQDNFPDHFPGAWAAAHIGKGNAALRSRKLSDTAAERARKLSDAVAEFESVTNRGTPGAGVRPTPRLLIAHAWHGQGDAIAADIPTEVATQGLRGGASDALANAATYFESAAKAFPLGDPLRAEARLDRANVLYVIARVAAKQFTKSLFTTPSLPPTDAIRAAEEACLKVQDSYTKTGAPAVWAELQRRLGDLFMIKMRWLVPANMRPPLHLAAAAIDILASNANEKTALETAKQARDYFTEACDVFAPSYLPMSWLDAQFGLIRSQLIIARLMASDDPVSARSLYLLCLTTIDAAIDQIAQLGYSPLDWVDLQLLRAQSEIGIGLLDQVNASAQFTDAKTALLTATNFLEGYTRLHQDAPSNRTAAQQADAKSLSEEIARAMPDN